ncbi:MAG: biopolymer transporter ExbD [Flavobacteriales bacterium]|nr:biopolymer transporter ExbD [Flavobacteriales bacterium]
MAEIIASNRSRTSHRSPTVRLDMTPMVDLAFLLLTFFILTTTLRRLEGLDLLAPLGRAGKASDKTITFLLAGRDSIYGYAGPFDPATTPPKRLGLDQVRAALGAVKDTAGLTLLVKPSASVRYANVVDILDEFTLAGLAQYHVADSMTAEESSAINRIEPDRRSLP